MGIPLKFKATERKKTHLADDVRFFDGNVRGVPPHRAEELLRAYPDNFEIFGYPSLSKAKLVSKGKIYTSKYNLGIFIDNLQAKVSGGRYHSWLFANLLADTFNVTVVTNGDPAFYQKIINHRHLRVVIDEAFGLDWKNNEFNFLLASPKWGGLYAYKYATKWHIPCYLMVLEPPNFTRLYRTGHDAMESYWLEYKLCLQRCNQVILSTRLTGKYAQKWLNISPQKITVIYPPLNQSALPKEPIKEEHAVVWISRMIGAKRPYDPVEVAKMVDPTLKINYIAPRSPLANRVARRAKEYGIKVEFFLPNDVEKFKIISRSKFMIHSSIFEGFGMPPGEALLCKKPCIAYDLPILKEIYKDKLEYARMKDVKDMAKIAKKLLTDDAYRKRRGEEGYQFAKNLFSFERARKQLKDLILRPRITFSIIVFEGEDYIKKCLKGIYDEAYQIIICEGAVKIMSDIKGYYRSRDKTVEIIKNFPDPEGRIKLIQIDRPWRDKAEMKQAILSQARGDIYFQVDVDEFYHKEDIHKIRDTFNNSAVDMVTFGAYHFWKDTEYIITGGKWDGNNFRVWRIKGKMEYKDHRHPDRDGKPYTPKHFKAVNWGRLRYHYGYVRDGKAIEDKVKFMSIRDKHLVEQYASDLKNWKGNGGNIVEFKGRHPEVIENAIKRSTK